MKFADVILPLSLPKLYTYSVPDDLSGPVYAGQRVVVQFGKHKLYSAVIRRIHSNPPQGYTPKPIEGILDSDPVVNEMQMRLWDWISNYYMCTLGEVMNAALPSSLKLSSEARYIFNTEYGTDFTSLNDNEYIVAEALQKQPVLSLPDIGRILGKKNVYPVIKSLIGKNCLLAEEELKERYKPRMVKFVRLTPGAEKEERLREIFTELEKAPKQLHVLMMYVQLSKRYTLVPEEVKKGALQKAASVTAIVVAQLEKKKILEVYEKEVGRLGHSVAVSSGSIEFSENQEKAYREIKKLFDEKNVVLLHGVTSSGKTEIYIKLIEETIREGKQVLYLLPEIALTTQIISRLSKHFGNKVGVYHSRFNQSERVEIWNTILSNIKPSNIQHPTTNYSILLGARSALFLPFSNIGLVIVDEEHDHSFKQYDPAPRYHARDAAIVLAKMHGAKVLLGSATPAVETYWNVKEGRYGLVELMERYGGVQLPEIVVTDIKEATRKKMMKSHFSPLLMEEMKLALSKREQIILFQNRRGFSPYLQCDSCAGVIQCTRCDVRLTYHKHYSEMRCHYCGYKIPYPKACPACGDVNMKMKGFGTEKIEEELAVFFPDAKIARLDFDTTRSRHAYRHIISDFEERNIDILVGTQMVTKGLDFDNVSLVGVLNADNMLYFPDFRAFERSFQLMAQVAGRAGRKNKRGKVIIQTWSPSHTVIRCVVDNDYISLYNDQSADRKEHNYPPFCRLIQITLKHRNREKLEETAVRLAEALREKLGKRVLGPEYPIIPRINNYYHQEILLKIERAASTDAAKQLISEKITELKMNVKYRSVAVMPDVDPV